MARRFSDLKENIEKKLFELQTKRKVIIGNFRKKVEGAKIEQIKNSIFK